jgi:hypothetical protein
MMLDNQLKVNGSDYREESDDNDDGYESSLLLHKYLAGARFDGERIVMGNHEGEISDSSDDDDYMFPRGNDCTNNNTRKYPRNNISSTSSSSAASADSKKTLSTPSPVIKQKYESPIDVILYHYPVRSNG